jgi:hypothetical protein
MQGPCGLGSGSHLQHFILSFASRPEAAYDTRCCPCDLWTDDLQERRNCIQTRRIKVTGTQRLSTTELCEFLGVRCYQINAVASINTAADWMGYDKLEPCAAQTVIQADRTTSVACICSTFGCTHVRIPATG